jgi:hypothetical protein
MAIINILKNKVLLILLGIIAPFLLLCFNQAITTQNVHMIYANLCKQNK